jgi:transposase
MERLEVKQISGHSYYYYSKWAWVEGKCRRVWQRYLGKLRDIVRAVEGGGPPPLYAEVFQWALPLALWRESGRAEVVEQTDRLCPKRQQGLSPGQYLALAAVNRAIRPRSKRSFGEWFAQTALVRELPQADAAALASQRFWDHMDRIQGERPQAIWKEILRGVVEREAIDVSSVSYDGTNFYTFLDTFNVGSTLAKRGKNKQGRHNLRQVQYALFCSADGHVPLFYDVYEGNRNDARQFPLMLRRFEEFFREIGGANAPEITLVFDKGNNSADNFALLDTLPLHFVGSVKLDEHKDLACVSNRDSRFVPCQAPDLEGTQAFRVRKTVYGRERTLVVTYNPDLFEAQWLTVQHDIAQAVEKLAHLRQRLEDRRAEVIRGGKAPTVESVRADCRHILSRQHLKRLIRIDVADGPKNVPTLTYEIDAEAVATLSDTYLGKTILITSRQAWDNDRVIVAYRSQFIIEDVFKEMKDRETGTWWPAGHWTDSKIRVHALYCTIALLLRAVLLRRVRQAGLHLSLKRLLAELDTVREVVNIYPRKRRQTAERRQTVLTKTSEMQQKLLALLDLKREETAFLG